jgi:adenosylcobinamide-GDP ribazoletransferase
VSLPPPVRGARAAVVFLTRIPAGGFPYRAEDWAWAPAHFPLIGALLGGAVGAMHHVLWPLGAPLDAVFVIAASMLLTGAFHEDGLADTCDALGGSYDREKLLAILKDSRVGAFGASALVVSIAGRIAALATLGHDAAWALVLVACCARVGPIWLMPALPYVTSDAASKSRVVVGASWPQAVVATAWVALVLGGAVHFGVLPLARAAALATACALVTVATGAVYARRLGGITGDFLGATEQIAELASYAVLAWGHA